MVFCRTAAFGVALRTLFILGQALFYLDTQKVLLGNIHFLGWRPQGLGFFTIKPERKDSRIPAALYPHSFKFILPISLYITKKYRRQGRPGRLIARQVGHTTPGRSSGLLGVDCCPYRILNRVPGQFRGQNPLPGRA